MEQRPVALVMFAFASVAVAATLIFLVGFLLPTVHAITSAL